MFSKNIKLIILFALVALVATATPAMVQADKPEIKGQLFIKEVVNIENDERKEINRLGQLLKNGTLTGEEIRDIKEQREAIKLNSTKITPTLSNEKKIEIRGHIDTLGNVMNKLYADGTVPIISVGTHAEHESVQIRILKDGLTEEKILQYEKIIRKIVGDKINITIIPSEPGRLTTCWQTLDCNPLEAGAKISLTNGGSCSMGFKASYDNKTGFVTAGHCLSGDIGGTGWDVGQPLPFAWDKIGTVHANAFTNNTWCDCMFVNTTETISSDVFSSLALDGVLFPSIDDYVYAEGITTQGEGGQISDTYQHFTTELNGEYYTIKGAVQVDFTYSNGDSGGPVYEDVSSGTPRFAGIISGNVDGYGYYIPHYRITNEFSGLTFTYS